MTRNAYVAKLCSVLHLHHLHGQSCWQGHTPATCLWGHQSQTKEWSIFFLRLPSDHHGPVSKMFNSRNTIYVYTGPFNWGEAHCAGEKVKRKREDQRIRSHFNINRPTTKTKEGAAHHGNQEPPGQAPSCTGRNQHHKRRDFKQRINMVRLNVHRCLHRWKAQTNEWSNEAMFHVNLKTKFLSASSTVKE